MSERRDQREPVPLSEVPALGRHVLGAYYLGLKDAGIIGYGEDYKAIFLAMERFGLKREQLGIRDNEGHPRMYADPDAAEQVGQQLLDWDSHRRQKYGDVVPCGYWYPPLGLGGIKRSIELSGSKLPNEALREVVESMSLEEESQWVEFHIRLARRLAGPGGP